MAYMAQWGPKGFVISPHKIVPLDNFSTSMKLKTDSENDTSGTQPVNTRGRELRPISFETTYWRALGVDPRAQIEEWEAQIGQAYPLYVGTKRFGPPKMILTEVSTSDIKLTASGEMLSCKIALKFEEHSDGKKSKLRDESPASKQEAMQATASTSDRAAKKP